MPSYKLSMPKLTVTIRQDQAEWLTLMARQSGVKVSAMVREALDGYRAVMASSPEKGIIDVGVSSEEPTTVTNS